MKKFKVSLILSTLLLTYGLSLGSVTTFADTKPTENSGELVKISSNENKEFTVIEYSDNGVVVEVDESQEFMSPKLAKASGAGVGTGGIGGFMKHYKNIYVNFKNFPPATYDYAENGMWGRLNRQSFTWIPSLKMYEARYTGFIQ